ncbi:MAG: PEGA domain-containing protein [bacterium]|nr:PEGA domain-containing protein [bacterium]
MNSVIVNRDGQAKSYAIDDLPLSIGGEGSEVALPTVDSPTTVAYIGFENGDFFVQPADPSQPTPDVTVNGLPLNTSRWIAEGDELSAASTHIWFRLKGGNLLVTVEVRNSVTSPNQVPMTAASRDGEMTVTPIPFSPRWQSPPPRRRYRIRLRLITALAVLALLAAGAWFVMTAHTVRVETLPGAEKIDVEGGLALKIGGRYLLRPGTYTVGAEHPGYLDLRTELVVGPQTPPVVQFELQPLGASLAIRSRPVDGATVFVDGTEIGTTPVDNHQLSAGFHSVELRAPLHLPYANDLEVKPGAEPITLEIDLEPNWAPIAVASNPQGATVLLDGESFGTTPLTGEVESGSRVVEIRRGGFKPYTRRMEVTTGEMVDLGTVQLVPLDGKLAVTSAPDGATVTIDREFRGTTPIQIDVRPDTHHELKLSLSGHSTYSTTVSVGAGKLTSLNVTMEVLTGEVIISSQPPQAEVLIDGVPKGKTEQRLELDTQPHEIVIQLEGYVPFRTVVTPQVGIPQSVRADLREEGPAGLPKRVESPQGVEMILVAPGRMTMGASRREPGRRANEVLRDVEITKAFYLAVREVSNQEFREFKSAHMSGAFGGQNLEIDHHPVVNVTWQNAALYCNWLSQKMSLPPVYIQRGGTLVARRPMPNGYRLPTEAEWALAARAASTTDEQKYGWGNALPIPLEGGNYGDLSAAKTLDGSLPNYRDGYPATAPVGSFQANAVGIFNLGGNVSEWVQDLYALAPTTPGSVEKDPSGPLTGAYHVIRGASWMDTTVTELRLSFRDYGDSARPDVGFRIARNAQ